jgi:nucleoid-associated protein YgaU
MTSRMRLLRCLLTAALAATLAAAACSHGPVPPSKDPAKGEFYLADELRRLPPEEMDRYCSWMEATLQSLKDQAVVLKARLDSLKVVGDTLRDREVRISASTRDASQRLRELRLREKASNTYVVTAGDNLRKIARTVFGDGTRWKDLYEANKALIGAEDAELKPGTRLTIPRSAGDAQ